MSDANALDERLRAVERALTDDDSDLTDLRDAAELTREIETLADRLDDAEDRLEDLDAATQALRGYVGNVRAVNESVERRADAALAKAESVESELGESEFGEFRPEQARTSPTGKDRRIRTCDCECDRSHDVEDADSDREDSGLLARIAEAL